MQLLNTAEGRLSGRNTIQGSHHLNEGSQLSVLKHAFSVQQDDFWLRTLYLRNDFSPGHSHHFNQDCFSTDSVPCHFLERSTVHYCNKRSWCQEGSLGCCRLAKLCSIAVPHHLLRELLLDVSVSQFPCFGVSSSLHLENLETPQNSLSLRKSICG